MLRQRSQRPERVSRPKRVQIAGEGARIGSRRASSAGPTARERSGALGPARSDPRYVGGHVESVDPGTPTLAVAFTPLRETTLRWARLPRGGHRPRTGWRHLARDRAAHVSTQLGESQTHLASRLNATRHRPDQVEQTGTPGPGTGVPPWIEPRERRSGTVAPRPENGARRRCRPSLREPLRRRGTHSLTRRRITGLAWRGERTNPESAARCSRHGTTSSNPARHHTEQRGTPTLERTSRRPAVAAEQLPFHVKRRPMRPRTIA